MNICEVEKVCNMVKRLLKARPDICPHEYHKLKSYEREDNISEIHYKCKWCDKYKISLVHHKPKKNGGPSDEK